MNKALLCITALLAGLAGCAGISSAGTAETTGTYPLHSSMEELAAYSDTIVLATASSSSVASMGGYQYEVVEFSVDEVYTGTLDASQPQLVKQLYSSSSLHYSAQQVAFAPGKQYYLCLLDTNDGYFMPVNPLQGVYRRGDDGLPVAGAQNPVPLELDTL